MWSAKLLFHHPQDPPLVAVGRSGQVFVVLNEPGTPVQYFIVPGKTLVEEPERFPKCFLDPKFPGFDWKVLRDGGYESAWNVFDAE